MGIRARAWTADWRNLVHNHEMRWPYVFVSGYLDGLQVFSVMDPTNPVTNGNHDVYLHEIDSNSTLAITRDDDVNQMDPQVLLEEVAWIEVDTEGDSVLKVYSGETFQPYSSVILQSAIVMLMPLLFLWAYQAASER